ncbi:MAG: DUF3574 domain-containing protein [Alphaproteobacteria bacterium]|nr:DUF3574 domain-containing protein [Alphaproteobacteria bacterium]
MRLLTGAVSGPFAAAAALLIAAPAILTFSAVPAGAACLLATQKPMTEAELLFGRDIPGGGTVSDADWTSFVDTALAVTFPDGFTIDDAQGGWRDVKTGAAVREASKIVLVDGDGSAMFGARLERVAEAYRKRFHQDAVGIVTREVCAAF